MVPSQNATSGSATQGNDYAYANYDKILFRDGTSFTAPMVIRYVETGGKGYLKWISLEDGKKLVLYKKPF